MPDQNRGNRRNVTVQEENERLRKALASCLRDRREADKVYLHATSALGPNQASAVLASEPTPFERKAQRMAGKVAAPGGLRWWSR